MDAPATDLVVFSLAAGADLGSTHYALSRCPTRYEGNPFMREPAVALAAKAAAVGLEAYACHRLRKTGHPRAAKVLRWVVVGLWLGVSANNVHRASHR